MRPFVAREFFCRRHALARGIQTIALTRLRQRRAKHNQGVVHDYCRTEPMGVLLDSWEGLDVCHAHAGIALAGDPSDGWWTFAVGITLDVCA
jgi:hypothetical protein